MGRRGRGGFGRLLPPGHKYPENIGSLQYLATNVRPEIAQAVNVLSRYRAPPTWAIAGEMTGPQEEAKQQAKNKQRSECHQCRNGTIPR